MARRIPDETLQAIRERTSIVEVISAYVSLKRAGRNHVGLCPFHSEKTPSFTVSEERGLFHCFGCGASGTAFTFLMKIERLEFPDAVTQLAKRAGVALPAQPGDDPAAARRELVYAANAAAERFFREALAAPAGAGAQRYLTGRGLHPETIARYGLGFAPAIGTALADWLARQGVAREVALQAGLLARSDDGRVYDRFRGRVMFPIRDRRGRTIAFGGRTLGEDQPKYLNSPESPVFRKGEGLYGIAEAREAIRAADRAVLVEGYMDALLLVQEGIPYAVATLGTALTAAQLRLLPPLGGDQLHVFFFFDGDRAGRQAALRTFAICAEAGVWGRAAFLPDGFDPDSYARQHGAAATLAILDAAPPLVESYFDGMLPPHATLPQRTRVAEDVRRIVARVASPMQRMLLARRASERLGISDDELLRSPSAPTAARPAARGEAEERWSSTELMLLKLMAIDAEVACWVAAAGTIERLRSPDVARAALEVSAAHAGGQPLSGVIDQLPPALAEILTGTLLGEASIAATENRLAAAQGLAQRIDERAARTHRQTIVSELRRAETSNDDEWRARLADLRDELRRREGGAG